MKHINRKDCPSCSEKLLSAHRDLIVFAAYVRAADVDAHISWAHRGEEDQNKAYSGGFSRVAWPLSKHNKTPAEALDWFHLDKFGQAHWDAKWLERVLRDACIMFGLIWGGNWKRKDFPHVEMA
jgi:peptidoglycan LD-endopeptidase CwlK